MKLYEKACELGDVDGCVLGAFSYRAGKEIPKDEEKAKKLIKMACSYGYKSSSCNE